MRSSASAEERMGVLSALEAKRASSASPATSLEAELTREADRSIGAEGLSTARLAARFLEERLQASGSGEGPGYFRHSLRVALGTLLWDPAPSIETLAIAVLHNAYEVCGLDEASLSAAGFSIPVTTGVRALTIERSRDEDDAYLRQFYAGVELAGNGVALVRCADKIDNLLGYDIVRGEPGRIRYVDLAERFVLPIAYRLSEPLGRHFAAVIEHTRSGH